MKHFSVSRSLGFLLGALGMVTALATIASAVFIRHSLASSAKVATEVTI